MLNDSFEEDWIKKVSWQWPQMQEADELNHQNAVEKKFANLTGSFRDEYGSDWREKLMQIKEEIDWCKANNIPHPSFAMKSGGERTGADSEIKEDNEDI